MDKIKNELDLKLNYIKERYNKLNKKCNFKNELLLYDKINNYLNKIEILLDDYEIENSSNMKIDDEINERIKNNQNFRKMIKDLGPILLYYQFVNTT